MNTANVLAAAGLIPAVLGATAASTGSGLITGLLRDEGGLPIANAVVQLENRLSGHRQMAPSDATGRFTLFNVPFNDYHLEAMAPGFQTAHWDLAVHSALPLQVKWTLKVAGAMVIVEERANLLEDHASSHVDIDKSLIEQIPAVVGSRGMENILLTTPGFIQDENGRFHFRGSHGQIMYVIDGVPVTDQVQASFSNSLDPGQVDSMEVITGGISAEFGGKPVAVVNLSSKSGLGTHDGFMGSLSAGVARFRTTELGFDAKGCTDRFGYFVTLAGSGSDRFLDPVNFDNLHNQGETGRLFTRFDWLLTDTDTMRLSVSGGATRREVANLASQEDNGQDQRVRNGDSNLSLGWTHLFEANRSLEAVLYHRHSKANLDPTRDLEEGFPQGGPDFPIWARQDRSLDNQGLALAYTQKDGANTFKTGLQFVRYPIHERFAFAITDPDSPLLWNDQKQPDPANPLYPYSPGGGGHVFHFDESIAPSLASAFFQDDLKSGEWTFGLGLRLDSYHGRGFVQNQFQPRLAFAYTVPATHTLLRAVYDRLLVTPENEGLAFTTSQYVWTTTQGQATPVAKLRSELQDSFLTGLDQQLGELARLSLDYWWKVSENAADSSQFANTGLLFPIAASRGRFHGLDLRLETVPVRGVSGYLSAGTVRTLFYGPTIGGLDAANTTQDTRPYLIDHDQKLTAQAGLRYERAGFHGQIVGRYDSGLEAGDPNDPLVQRYPSDYAFGIPFLRSEQDSLVGTNYRIKSRTIWNLDLGQEFQLAPKQSLTVAMDLLNLFDAKALYNFLSTFGGTHVVPPRTLALHLVYKF